jgi:hypothetical protein
VNASRHNLEALYRTGLINLELSSVEISTHKLELGKEK